MDRRQGVTQKLHSPGNERMTNLELLRIVSMLLVVILHFIGKSSNHPVLTDAEMEAWEYGAWALESFAIVAVNVYMLLSGYLLAGSVFKVKRLVQLWLQLLFYSAGVGIVAAMFGYIPKEGISLYYLTQLFLPVSTNHYWFMTAYVLMYLFLPVLMAGVGKLTKKQFQIVLCVLFFVFCGMKSVLPIKLTTDMQGYDCIWYLCMALLAAYIRLYGITFFRNKKRSLLVYLISATAIFSVSMLFRCIYIQTGKLSDIVMVCYNYNHILVVLASVGFFCLFLHMQINSGLLSRVICKLAPYTLGVYLWHENIAIRYEWPLWIQNFLGGATEGTLWFLALFISVVAVFAIGICLDMIRSLLFKGAHKLLLFLKPYRKLDTWLSGLVIDVKVKEGKPQNDK